MAVQGRRLDNDTFHLMFEYLPYEYLGDDMYPQLGEYLGLSDDPNDKLEDTLAQYSFCASTVCSREMARY